MEKGGHGNLEVTASLSLEAVGPGAAHPDSEEEGGESEGAMAMAKARLWARPIFSIARSPPSFLPNPVAPHLAPLLLCRPALINPSSLLSLLFFVTIAPTSKICFTIGSFGVAPLRVVVSGHIYIFLPLHYAWLSEGAWSFLENVVHHFFWLEIEAVPWVDG